MTAPVTIAAHLRTLSAPAVDAAARQLATRLPHSGDPAWMGRRVVSVAVALEPVDLTGLAHHLTAQRALAAEGRPRGESGRSTGLPWSPTEAAAAELHRIRIAGLEVREAIDRLFPDPAWPAIRTRTAVEALDLTAAAAWGTFAPGMAWADLDDAVEGVEVAGRHVLATVAAALKVRAWGKASEVDPPPLPEARCSGRLNAGCENWIGAEPHRHPETGSVHWADVCDECYRLVCPECWTRQRRTPGAKRCSTCETREWRKAA